MNNYNTEIKNQEQSNKCISLHGVKQNISMNYKTYLVAMQTKVILEGDS
jgi:hypothetical protein